MYPSAGPAYLGASAAPFVPEADPNAPNFALPGIVPLVALSDNRLDARKRSCRPAPNLSVAAPPICAGRSMCRCSSAALSWTRASRDRGNQGGRPTGALSQPSTSCAVEYAMSSPSNSGSLDARVRKMQVIWAALLMGALTALGIVMAFRLIVLPRPLAAEPVAFLFDLAIIALFLFLAFIFPGS
jgi:hypothetical protein